jgi:kynureninase
VNFRDLSEQEKRALLFEAEEISKDGMTPVPIMVEVSLPKPIRLFNAARLSRRRARSLFLDSLVTRSELDRLFRVRVFRVRMPRKKSERRAQSSLKPKKISEDFSMP